ncbi:MAG: Hsp20/alpha crystallin family protein [Oligoflexia bacterium]|nr:Hsp20/alpha crystallin family protein [Oligoflexia bacterium]
MKKILFLSLLFSLNAVAQQGSVFDKLMNDPNYLQKFFKKDFLDKMQMNDKRFRDLLNDNSVFHDGFIGMGGLKTRWLKESGQYILLLESDGISDDELNFEIKDNVIFIKGTIVNKIEQNGMKSISQRSFSRSELIPDNLDPKTADFKKTERGIEIGFKERASTGNKKIPKKKDTYLKI